MKLTIPEFHVGRAKAEKYIALLCKELNLPVPKGQEFAGIITINNGHKSTEIHLAKEVESVRRNGKADILQMIFDSSDTFLNTPLSIDVTTSGGLKVKIESKYGSHSSVVNSPGFIEAPETSFSQDIVFYRKQAVQLFNRQDKPGFARAYRGYLQSCVSLVECFIHRYTFHVKNMIPSMQEFDNTATLDSRSSIDDRLDAWMNTFAIHKMKDFKNSKSRLKFLELKIQRNAIVHPSYPSVPYEVKDTIKFLDYCQDGVGGLLGDLRNYAGYSENIGFIKQIRSQGEVRIA